MKISTKKFTSVVLLAAGAGSRMGDGVPKQFRMLSGKPVALYSFELFDALSEVDEIIVVCDSAYCSLFTSKKPLRFALGGKRRQDSVYNGLLQTSQEADLVAVHDAARPFVEREPFLALLEEAGRSRASALALPTTNTIKQIRGTTVLKTLPRQELWEMQTPQVVERALLFEAYEHVLRHKIEATDEISLVEALGLPTTVVKSSPRNFKITHPFDWIVAESCVSN